MAFESNVRFQRYDGERSVGRGMRAIVVWQQQKGIRGGRNEDGKVRKSLGRQSFVT